ncbi:DUF2272 domain-containing protein [Actinomycetospora aeridis]|uniref:DUF2272 domain-containing protein n=1 Tax=Actinomycetospora aeridis TaxID=3129231 RepID=A0ABU8N1P6_9PSEU
MTRPLTWDWAESFAAPADEVRTVPETTWSTAPSVFRPAGEEPEAEEPEAEELGEEGESGEVELAEWELAASPVEEEAFPSGVTLSPATGATGKDQEHWDPNGTGLPLLATGSAVRSRRLAPNFTVGELVSSGGRAAEVARISPALVRCLQAVRDRVGKPVTVSSGYRSWARNVELYRGRGQTPTKSRHCSGQAADISVAGMSGLDLAKALLDACGRDVAVGIGATYAHVDVRGTWARWSYASGDAARRDIAAIDAHRAGAPAKPAPAPGRVYGPPAPGAAPPSAGSLRARIVEVAQREPARWGTRTETDPAMTAVLQEYYRAVPDVPLPSASDLQSGSWQSGHPWSAVFISWVMRQAGAGPSFVYSTAHRVYVAAAKKNAEAGDTANPFWAYPVEKITPDLGDLVCADREGSAGCGGVTYATIDNGTAWPTHCDVVTSVDRAARRITAIGGNVGDRVKVKSFDLDAQGFLLPQQPGERCRMFAVVKVRDGTATQRELEDTELEEEALARAVRLNSSYSGARGWPGHRAAAGLLGGASPTSRVFAQTVARWQRRRGLTPDGVVGPDTGEEVSRVLGGVGHPPSEPPG